MRHKTNFSINELHLKQKLYELAKAEILYKLSEHKKVDIHEILRTRYYPVSYRFYESVDILLHKSIGET